MKAQTIKKICVIYMNIFIKNIGLFVIDKYFKTIKCACRFSRALRNNKLLLKTKISFDTMIGIQNVTELDLSRENYLK